MTARVARNLLLVIDGSKTGRQWLGLVQGLGAALTGFEVMGLPQAVKHTFRRIVVARLQQVRLTRPHAFQPFELERRETFRTRLIVDHTK